QRSRGAVLTAERFADGLASREELCSAWREAREAVRAAWSASRTAQLSYSAAALENCMPAALSLPESRMWEAERVAVAALAAEYVADLGLYGRAADVICERPEPRAVRFGRSTPEQ